MTAYICWALRLRRRCKQYNNAGCHLRNADAFLDDVGEIINITDYYRTCTRLHLDTIRVVKSVLSAKAQISALRALLTSTNMILSASSQIMFVLVSTALIVRFYVF